MKEHVQKTGVRKWAGQDLVDLQHEPLAAVTAFFEEYGSSIIKGCEVVQTGSTHTVQPGMVALAGTDQDGQPTFKVAPFAGITDVTLPIYLVLSFSILERPYADLKVKPVAYDFRAAATGVKPADKPYIEIGTTGGVRFVDVVQDDAHLFTTKAERDKLASIEAGANKYTHPATHPASMVVQDDQNRFVSTAKIGEWDAKATTAYVAQQIAALVASSPAALDTLNELAAALGNDPNFATTMTNALAGKANKATTLGGYGITDSAQLNSDVLFKSIQVLMSGFGSVAALSGNWSGAGNWGIGSNTSKGPHAISIDLINNITKEFLNGTDIELFLGLNKVHHSGNFNPASYATTAYVAQQVAALVASSPASLDTLNELAAALGNDPNFATTMTNALAGKAPVGHNHNGVYQPAGSYAPAAHSHDGTYQPAGNYAPAAHDHSGVYQPAGSYQPAGNYMTDSYFPSTMLSADGSKKEHFLDVICAGTVNSSGGKVDYWGENRVSNNLFPFESVKISNGKYRVTHNSNTSYYGVVVTALQLGNTEEDNYATWQGRSPSDFVVNVYSSPGALQDMGFSFIMYRLK